MSRKNSLHVRSVVFWGLFFFSLVFCRRRLFVFCFCCSFQERKLRANRTHPTRTLCSCSFFLSLSPPHRVYLPFWPCVLFFSRFVGVPFWAPGVLAFSWILSVLWGARDYAPPSEALFSDARRQGCLLSILLLSCVVFPLLCCFARPA